MSSSFAGIAAGTITAPREPAPQASFAGVLAEGAADIDAATLSPVGLLSDQEILALARSVEALGRRVDALRVSVAGEIDARARVDFGEGSLAARHGCRNATELLQRVTFVSAKTAARRFSLARSTRPEVGHTGHVSPPKLPAVLAALESGELCVESAEVIAHALGRLPAHADPVDVSHAEQCLVAAACGTAPPDGTAAAMPEHADNVRVMASAWHAALDQDGEEPSFDEQHLRRYLRLGREKDGLVPLHGAVSPEVAALVGRMFDAINSPRSRETTGGGAGGGGAAADPGEPRVRFAAVCDSTEPSAGGSDLRTPDQKRHDAFAAIAQAASQHEDMPSLGGAAVTVLIQVEETQLLARHGNGWIHGHDGTPTPISLTGVEHATCSGRTQRVVQNSDGRIIELGTAQRVFNAHQRRAIALRDGGCIIPGCTVPATWCEIHHVHEHRDGGATHTDNGVALCWYHHRSLGTSGWAIRMTRGVPEILAPPWIDPHLTWRPTRPPLKPPGISRPPGLDTQQRRES